MDLTGRSHNSSYSVSLDGRMLKCQSLIRLKRAFGRFVHYLIRPYSSAGNWLDFHNQSSVWPAQSMIDCVIG